MKKMSVIAMAVAAGAGVAVASSLSVPWFADNAGLHVGVPAQGLSAGQAAATELIYLKSNVDHVVTCSIEYFNADGVALGPQAPNNSFTIQPKSALAFRPCAADPDATVASATIIDAITGASTTVTGANGGQEGGQGVLVPDRPRSANATTPIVGHPTGAIDTKRNGSCTISWSGGPGDVQGFADFFSTTMIGTQAVGMSTGHTLPPGF